MRSEDRKGSDGEKARRKNEEMMEETEKREQE